jgi:hypothetical protein
MMRALASPAVWRDLPGIWRDIRRADKIEIRGNCLHVLDRRPADRRDQPNLTEAVRGALATFPEASSMEKLVGSELMAVVATPNSQNWQGAPSGVSGLYFTPFDAPMQAKPHYLAIELYGAAAVHRIARKHGITRFQRLHIPWLQHVAWQYQESLMKTNNMPEDWFVAFQQLRSVVPEGLASRL